MRASKTFAEYLNAQAPIYLKAMRKVARERSKERVKALKRGKWKMPGS
jgi:hypothetical protein